MRRGGSLLPVIVEIATEPCSDSAGSRYGEASASREAERDRDRAPDQRRAVAPRVSAKNKGRVSGRGWR